MSFKSVAMHLDDVTRCAMPVALAARIAMRFQGRLVGIAPTGVPDAVLTMTSADLIVSGGCGHSRPPEWALGGVTRHLLEHMTVPVLYSH